jgi:DNA topoisomerase III
MKRKDVTALINACDAGREGELIFRYIVEAAEVKKPIQRLWMQSMTQGAILDAFKHLRTDEEMLPLADAAKCRSESDWLVGINATRAFTALNSRHGGFRLTPVGRVQTPTLTILANRELEIQGFVPRTYYEVIALFGVPAGRYNGRWINEAHKKDENDEHKKAERLWSLEEAQAIVDRCVGKPGKIEQVTKPTRQAPRCSTTSPPSSVRPATASASPPAAPCRSPRPLYEKFKVLTYPRTDSRYLPEDYLATSKTPSKPSPANAARPTPCLTTSPTTPPPPWTISGCARTNGSLTTARSATTLPSSPPASSPPKNCQRPNKNCSTWCCAALSPYSSLRPNLKSPPASPASGRTPSSPTAKSSASPAGWPCMAKLAAEEAAAAEGKDAGGGGKLLIAARDGDSADTLDVEANELQTKPPARFTEATLLGTMENAGKLVEDEELAEAMSERGLGTPATRAAIIEGLIMDKYIERDGRDFHVTAKGLTLIDQISTIGIETLSSPEMTGQWEYKLRQMEQNELDRTSFMRDIRGLTTQIVERTKAYSKAAKDKVYPDFTALMPPHGQVDFKQTEEFYECKLPGVKLRIYKTVAGRELSDQEIRTLIEKRVVGPLDGFRSKKGKDFSAALQIGEDNKVTFLFPDGNDPEAIDWENAVPLCPCPICEKAGRKGQMIYDTADGYLCKLAASPKGLCNGRLPKELCKKAISPKTLGSSLPTAKPHSSKA